MGMEIQRDTRIGHGITTLQSNWAWGYNAALKMGIGLKRYTVEMGIGLQRYSRNGHGLTTLQSK
jgi:hypothetical protein